MIFNVTDFIRLKPLILLTAVLISGLGSVAVGQVQRNLSPAELNSEARAQLVFNKGMQALEMGDTQQAIIAFERVLRLDQRASNVRVLLGILYLDAGNAAQAEVHLQRALDAGNVPAKELPRVRSLLASAQQQQKSFFSRGSVSVGLQYETNANSGPDDTTTFTTGTAEEDFSAVFSADHTLDYVIDLGSVKVLRFDTQIYLSGYSKDVSPSSQFLALSAGPVWLLSDTSFVRPNLILSHVQRKGDPYRNQVGIGLGYEAALGETGALTGRAQIIDETFSAAGSATNPDRDGTMISVGARLDRQLGPGMFGFLDFGGNFKNAAQDYQSFTSYGFSGGLSWSIANPASRWEGDDIIAGVDLHLDQTSYEAPDQVNSATQARKDDRFSIGAFIQYPLLKRLQLTSQLAWTDNRSNYATEDYDNIRVFLGLTYRLGG